MAFKSNWWEGAVTDTVRNHMPQLHACGIFIHILNDYFIYFLYCRCGSSDFCQEADVTRRDSYACRDLLRLASDVYRLVSFPDLLTGRHDLQSRDDVHLFFTLVPIALEIIPSNPRACHNASPYDVINLETESIFRI